MPAPAPTLLVLKTGALGDVLRTTSILPGLAERLPGCRVTWLTARGAVDLVAHHPRVAEVVGVDPADEAELERVGAELRDRHWERVLSFDDEEALCRLATRVVRAEGGAASASGRLSGAWLDPDGRRVYTPDVAPWFDMGLLSVHGKQRADELKVRNRRSHPAIFAEMLGIPMGEPELPLPAAAMAFGERFAQRTRLHAHGPVIGLNTGAGGRWESKKLPLERVVRIVAELDRRLDGKVGYLLLGGRDEAERNRRILDRLGDHPRIVDAGVENPLLEFAALIDRLDLLLTSDSLALHVGVARRVPVVAFFAPTSAAEIELYGRGERVVSTSPDACSYRSDADTSSLTPERLCTAVVAHLGSRTVGGGS